MILPSPIGNNPIIVSPVASSTFQTCRFCLHKGPICIAHHPSLSETAPEPPVPPRISMASLFALTIVRTRRSPQKDARLAKTGIPKNPVCAWSSPRMGRWHGRWTGFGPQAVDASPDFRQPAAPVRGVAGLRQSVSRHNQSQTPFTVTHGSLCLPASRICSSWVQTQAANQRRNTLDRHPILLVVPQSVSSSSCPLPSGESAGSPNGLHQSRISDHNGTVVLLTHDRGCRRGVLACQGRFTGGLARDEVTV